MNSEKLVYLILQDVNGHERLSQEFENVSAEEQVMLAVALQAKGLLNYIRKECIDKSAEDVQNSLNDSVIKRVLADYTNCILSTCSNTSKTKLFVAFRVTNFNKFVSQMVTALCFGNIILSDDDLLTLIVRTLISYYKIRNDTVPLIDTSVNIYKYRLKKAYGLNCSEDNGSSMQ
ncbi:MAG: hypothetical protein IJE43_19400 [Alphaproteobacteria bacterium]|nr:hypothetical protein [Alphaproteobacteria bacterium]